MVSMIEILKKHKERVALFGVVFVFFVSIGIGIYLQKNQTRHRATISEDVSITVRKKVTQGNHEQNSSSATQPNTSYFLKPSPEELLEQLASMENLNSEVINAKFIQLPVLWPGYYFTLKEEQPGKASLILDVSEDGFGVVLESEVNVNSYPQLRELSEGDRVWIGGKILAVDPAGTGRVFLAMETLSFGDAPPYLHPPEKPE